MSQQELLERVIRTLERYGVQYMLTDSVASSLQGEPRDALRIYEVQFGRLDTEYIMDWIKKPDIELLWKRLLESARIP